MLGRPCAFFTTAAGPNPCTPAHHAHTRATAGVESTKTPSRSKSTPRQWMLVIIHDRHKAAKCEMRRADSVSLARAWYKSCASPGEKRNGREGETGCATYKWKLSRPAFLPIVFKLAIQMAAAESQDRVGSSNGPEHS